MSTRFEHKSPTFPKTFAAIGFDATFADQRLVGLQAIAHFIGVSEKTAARYAKRVDCPIFKRVGRYIAFRDELTEWQRGFR